MPGGTRELETPALLRDLPSVTDEQLVAELAALALSLERDTGAPVDIECADERRHEVYLLQSTTDHHAPFARSRKERSMTQVDMPQPIPLPPDFPVVWDPPEDALIGSGSARRCTLPGQSTMLDDSFGATLVRRRASTPAARTFSMPVRNAHLRVNTYVVPVDRADQPRPGRARGARQARRRSGSALRSGVQTERWEGERLPEIKELLARWRAFDLAGASDAELVAHLRDTIAWASAPGTSTSSPSSRCSSR